MRVEGRELKPYAEPVSTAELREGEVYFAVNYVDDAMLTPVMETVVFIGRNLEPDDVGQAYFQDVESYREEVRYSWAADSNGTVSFSSGSETELKHIFNYDQALDELMKCSLRRAEAET